MADNRNPNQSGQGGVGGRTGGQVDNKGNQGTPPSGSQQFGQQPQGDYSQAPGKEGQSRGNNTNRGDRRTAAGGDTRPL
jgi:hypothetical protein